MEMNASQILSHLKALRVGDLDALRGKIQTAREACDELQQADLAGKLDEAMSALDRADMKTYRKRIETVIAKLGHLR
jgi:hypothetical protein